MIRFDLIILCGGKGSRLKNLTKNKPKPIIKINNKFFLDYLVQKYQRYNIGKIFFLAGYHGDKIKKIYHNKIFNFVESKVLIEKKPLGTGGCLSLIKEKVNNNLIIINGDSFFDFNLAEILKYKKNIFNIEIIFTKNVNYKEVNTLSNIGIKNGRAIIKKNSNFINCGIYLFNKNHIKKFSTKYQSLEKNFLEKKIMQGKVLANYQNGYFIDIGLKKNLNYAKKTLKKITKKPAVFLDRDGVLNYNFGYVHKYENFKWMNGSINALKYLNKKDIYIFIVTNQSGIGRGYYKINEFNKLHIKIKDFLSKKNIFIDEVVYCPHHPEFAHGKYRKKCKCRKPGNKLITDLQKKWNIDMKKSFMIGDQSTDEICAKKSKLNFFYRDKDLYKQIKKLI
jgi:D,D-heptose 1,7-bisphosphate phosphatase